MSNLTTRPDPLGVDHCEAQADRLGRSRNLARGVPYPSES